MIKKESLGLNVKDIHVAQTKVIIVILHNIL